jgi:uncharacterized membrane protein
VLAFLTARSICRSGALISNHQNLASGASALESASHQPQPAESVLSFGAQQAQDSTNVTTTIATTQAPTSVSSVAVTSIKTPAATTTVGRPRKRSAQEAAAAITPLNFTTDEHDAVVQPAKHSRTSSKRGKES